MHNRKGIFLMKCGIVPMRKGNFIKLGTHSIKKVILIMKRVKFWNKKEQFSPAGKKVDGHVSPLALWFLRNSFILVLSISSNLVLKCTLASTLVLQIDAPCVLISGKFAPPPVAFYHQLFYKILQILYDQYQYPQIKINK